MKNRNIHIYPSTLEYASRIFRITKSLAGSRLFDEITIIGYLNPGLQEHETIDAVRRIWRVPLRPFRFLGWRGRRILHYLHWLAKIVFRLSRQEIAMINCHSVFDLPIGVIVKKIKRCKLIYDTHELETERNGVDGVVQKIARLVENVSMRHVDHVFTVSPSCTEWYQRRYRTSSVTTIRNIPLPPAFIPTKNTCRLRDRLSIDLDDTVFLYVGALMPGRGIPLLLSVFSRIESNKHIVFMGYGEFRDKICACAETHKNIHFHEALPFAEMQERIREADVGMAIIENTCLSYYYCLPNKLFEYLLSGIPVIVSDFPDMAELITAHQCGWKSKVDENDIQALIQGLTRSAILEKRKNVLSARGQWSWQEEENKLLSIYRSLFPHPEDTPKEN